MIVWPEPSSWDQNELIGELREALRGRVLKAYLFGSHARGDAKRYSDVDVMLVCETALPWPERARPFLDLLEQFGPMDLLVYRPEEWKALELRPTPFFSKARSEWRELL